MLEPSWHVGSLRFVNRQNTEDASLSSSPLLRGRLNWPPTSRGDHDEGGVSSLSSCIGSGPLTPRYPEAPACTRMTRIILLSKWRGRGQRDGSCNPRRWQSASC